MKATVLNLFGAPIRVEDGSWTAILSRLSEQRMYKRKKMMPLLKLAEFKGHRCDENVTALHGVEGDYDAGAVNMQAALKMLEMAGIRASVYETPSSKPDAPRWRAVCPSSKPLPPSDHGRMVARLNGALGGILAGESFTLSQTYFFGQLEGGPKFEMLHTFDDPEEGTCIDQLDNLDEIAVWKVAVERSAKGGFDFARENLKTGDGRREILKSLIGVLCNEAKSEEAVLEEVRVFVAGHFSPQDAVDWRNVKAIISHIWKKTARPAQDFRPITLIDLGELAASYMEPTRFVCAPFVAEGYTLYVGNPKIGKTTLMRQLAVAAHTGGDFLGFTCEKTEVLFLSLEEGQRMFRKKVLKMGYQPADLKGLRVAFDWPSGEEGLNKLREHMKQYPATKLIIIDGMARIKGHKHERSASVFDIDYKEGRMLQEFAKEHPGLALIVLHHTRKMESFDPMDLVSGSHGVTAAPDMVCVLFKGPGGQFIMHWEGREWEEEENSYEILRDSGRWRYVGPMSEAEAGIAPNALRQASIVAILKERGEVSGKSLARDLSVTEAQISKSCKSLAALGVITRGELGWKIV